MTGETPAPAEQNESAAEFTERLRGKLLDYMRSVDSSTFVSGQGYQYELDGPTTPYHIDDYFSAELTDELPKLGGDSEAARKAVHDQALADGTAIFNISVHDRNQYPELSTAILVRPADMPEAGGGTLKQLLTDLGVDRDTAPVILGKTLGESRYSVIADPTQYPLLTDLASDATVPKTEGATEKAERERRGAVIEFARNLHSSLSSALPFDSFDGAMHSTTLQTESGHTVMVQDDYWQNLKGRGFSSDKQRNLQARREDLAEHITILSISSPNPDTTQPVDQYLTFIPAELNPASILGVQMYPIDRTGNPQQPAGEPVDMDSTDYVIWHITKGRIIDPASEPLLVDIAHMLEVAVPGQG